MPPQPQQIMSVTNLLDQNPPEAVLSEEKSSEIFEHISHFYEPDAPVSRRKELFVEGDRTEETIESEVQKVVGILNQLRANKRQQLVSEGGGYGQFEVGDLAPPPQPNLPGAPGATPAPASGTTP